MTDEDHVMRFTQQAEWPALPWEPNKDGGQRRLTWLPSVPNCRGLTLIIFTGTFHSIKYTKSYDFFIDQVNTGSCSFFYQIKTVWTHRHLNPAGTHTHQQTQTTESVWFRLEDPEMSNQQEVWSQNTQDVSTDTNWNFSIRNSVIQINRVNWSVWMFSGLNHSSAWDIPESRTAFLLSDMLTDGGEAAALRD